MTRLYAIITRWPDDSVPAGGPAAPSYLSRMRSSRNVSRWAMPWTRTPRTGSSGSMLAKRGSQPSKPCVLNASWKPSRVPGRLCTGEMRSRRARVARFMLPPKVKYHTSVSSSSAIAVAATEQRALPAGESSSAWSAPSSPPRAVGANRSLDTSAGLTSPRQTSSASSSRPTKRERDPPEWQLQCRLPAATTAVVCARTTARRFV
eukprot:scaffold61176_cov65-Phaeocystis_antarctica.AAC.6